MWHNEAKWEEVFYSEHLSAGGYLRSSSFSRLIRLRGSDIASNLGDHGTPGLRLERCAGTRELLVEHHSRVLGLGNDQRSVLQCLRPAVTTARDPHTHAVLAPRGKPASGSPPVGAPRMPVPDIEQHLGKHHCRILGLS
jgi:hypothetical protein